ncbi:RDD family protein [Dehalobacter sp. DCM]|uniref:RDD family protein n=1 Tax=Dehalobacter sp. DCM TaxID=2907827 RepID=UPI003081F1F0|nr:RDD family protein [Dehalobacter sp. DCM]
MEIVIDENISEQVIPNESVISLRAAGFWSRVAAFLFDVIVIGMSSRIFFNLVWPSGLENAGIQSFVMVNSLFPGIWGSLYFVLMTKFFGQTLGKMIMGIRVVNKDGRPLSWITVVMREVVGRTMSQLLGSYLGYLVCAFHPRKQGLTDIISDTYVVYVQSQKGRAVEIPAQSAMNETV